MKPFNIKVQPHQTWLTHSKRHLACVLSTGFLLLSTSAIANVNNTITTGVGAGTYTLTLKLNEAATISQVTLDSTIETNQAYTYAKGDADSCTSQALNTGDTCTVTINVTDNESGDTSNPTYTSVKALGADGNELAQAYLMLDTDTINGQNMAARRLPPIISSLAVPTITSGNSHTITWQATDYNDDTYTQVAIFDCSKATDPETTCGDSLQQGEPMVSDENAGTLVDDATAWIYVVSEGEGEESDNTEETKTREYSYDFTPATAGKYVMRFYQVSKADKDASLQPVSLLIPGGLAGDTPTFAYYDDYGRRIAVEVE